MSAVFFDQRYNEVMVRLLKCNSPCLLLVKCLADAKINTMASSMAGLLDWIDSFVKLETIYNLAQ